MGGHIFPGVNRGISPVVHTQRNVASPVPARGVIIGNLSPLPLFCNILEHRPGNLWGRPAVVARPFLLLRPKWPKQTGKNGLTVHLAGELFSSPPAWVFFHFPKWKKPFYSAPPQ